MKKLVLLFLVLTGMVSTVSATVKVYFKPNTEALEGYNWGQGNERYALYMFKNGEGAKNGWTNFTQIGSTGIYEATYDDDYYAASDAGIIICRMNGAEADNIWDNKWDQSGDLPCPTASIYYDKSSNNWQNDWTGSSANMATKTIYEDLTVEGSRHLTNGYKEWEAADANKATMVDGINTLLVSGKALKVGTYEYKYYTGSSWIPDGDNLTVSITEDGVYDLTYTFNQFTDTKSYTAEKKSSDPVEYRYYILEGTGNPITGNAWNDNVMTVNEGKATLTVNNVSLEKGTEYKFKIVEEVYLNNIFVDGSQYWSYNPKSGNMWSLTPNQATTCNVTFTYNIPTNFTYTESNVFLNITPLADSWYFIVGQGGNWTIGDKLTETSSGIFTGTLADWNNNYFAIAPSSAITGTSTIDWSKVVRPDDTDNKWLSFPWIYSDLPTVTDNANDYVWALYVNANKGSLEFTYNSNTKKWSAIPFIPLTLSNGFATFSYAHNDVWGQIAIPDGITAYYASAASAGKVTMTAIEGGKFPENEAVFLKAASTTQEYKFYSANSEEYTDPVTNLLVKGTDAGVTASNGSDSFNYVYALQSGVLGFYNVATDIATDMTGKAYLHTTSDIKPSGEGHIAIIFDDETTGIKQVESNKQSVEGYYNLAGQRVAQPTKGLYIVNGKKVIIK